MYFIACFWIIFLTFYPRVLRSTPREAGSSLSLASNRGRSLLLRSSCLLRKVPDEYKLGVGGFPPPICTKKGIFSPPLGGWGGLSCLLWGKRFRITRTYTAERTVPRSGATGLRISTVMRLRKSPFKKSKIFSTVPADALLSQGEDIAWTPTPTPPHTHQRVWGAPQRRE